ncbi:ATP-dependent DNA helicase PIF1-like [Chenopodium quinoa]|uniref:ATP-dependent DNA helicase PIF1-like n=1 Tax=Chenopodium quinoa TaxID=63459 RepID=UPI000B774CF2|nr:ATP-dependent DNA helicase PIF1-like [Chenopodium quinoa]
MLLNIIKGPTCFQDIRTVDGIICATYKETCYFLGLLDGDNEWNEVLKEAATWSNAPQLRELYVTILLFCEVSEPKTLWEEHWQNLSDDIQYRQRRRLGIEGLCLAEDEIQNYSLYEFEQILKRGNRSLKEFPGIPFPDMTHLEDIGNRMIMEEQNYDTCTLTQESNHLQRGLNVEQKQIYDTIIQSAYRQEGGVFFVYGSGGTGKTYLWRALISKLRSENSIVLVVASSGIASLLVPGGRTTHSRFKIPFALNEYSCCNIDQGSDLAHLIKKASLVIWDEALMAHIHAFEVVDRTFRDIMQLRDPSSMEKVFGGKLVVLGGDFRQVLPVVKKVNQADFIDASINKSSAIWPHCIVFKLETNMRLLQSSNEEEKRQLTEFSNWVLHVGDGKLPAIAKEGEDEPMWINIPDDLLIKAGEVSIEEMVECVYLDLLQEYTNPTYLQQRAILASKNDLVDKINDQILKMILGEEKVYKSANRVCPLTRTGVNVEALYPTEFLNTLQLPGIPNHELKLKVGCLVILLRNIDHSRGLCNGTRLIIVTRLEKRVIQAKVITGTHVGKKVPISRVEMSPSDTVAIHLKAEAISSKTMFCNDNK